MSPTILTNGRKMKRLPTFFWFSRRYLNGYLVKIIILAGKFEASRVRLGAGSIASSLVIAAAPVHTRLGGHDDV